MLFCDAIPADLAANLALDEALLLDAEAGGPEVLRVWHWPRHAVVIGAGGKWAAEADAAACQRDDVPIVRRSSGGGAVLLGPGCLCYSLVLTFDRDPALHDLHSSYRWILERMAEALRPFAAVAHAGISDLAVLGRKVAGSAEQRKRDCLLHHGTILLDFDLELLARYLRHPPREPEYRDGRGHLDFVQNLAAAQDTAIERLRSAWGAAQPLEQLPDMRLRALIDEKYAHESWHRRR